MKSGIFGIICILEDRKKKLFMVLDKSEMTEEDVKLQFRTPAILAKKYRLTEMGKRFVCGEQLV